VDKETSFFSIAEELGTPYRERRTTLSWTEEGTENKAGTSPLPEVEFRDSLE